MKRDPSPESRLLNLIRKKKKRMSVQSRMKSFLISHLKTHRDEFKTDPLLASIRLTRWGLAFSALIFVVTLGYSLQPNSLPKLSATQFDPIQKGFDSTKVPALNYYLSVIKKRNLFRLSRPVRPKPKKALKKPTPRPTPKPPSIRDLAKNFNLVGIIVEGDPQAIIEDTSRRKIHYLKKGEVINGITIDQIFEGKVILRYKDETLELIL